MNKMNRFFENKKNNSAVIATCVIGIMIAFHLIGIFMGNLIGRLPI